MAKPFEEEEVEVFNEEVMTLSAIQLWTGKLQVEMRVLGRLRIGGNRTGSENENHAAACDS